MFQRGDPAWAVAALFLAGPFPFVAAAGTSGGLPICSRESGGAQRFFFAVPPGSDLTYVFVAGDFNGWSTTATPLARASDGLFAANVDLPDGPHQYKLVVDGRWMTDPADDRSLEVPDTYGGRNSVVVAGLSADRLPPPRPGQIDSAAVVFDPADGRDLDVVSAKLVRLSLRARADDVTAATVLTGATRTPMSPVGTTAGMTRYAAVVPAGPFAFELRKPGAVAYVADGSAYPSLPADRYVPPAVPTFATPAWAKHAVWYQIFPERFCNGDTSNDPPNTLRWTSDWDQPKSGQRGGFYRNVFNRRYGGDLQGVRQALPYLRRLGITALYLNPIFQAQSLHKYDTTDYRHVDEHFGVAGDYEKLRGETADPATWQWTPSDRVFLDLVAEAHRQGFKVIIDGVFNHVGTRFWAFQDVVRNGRASPYAGWFDITDWNASTTRDGQRIPFHYKAWDGDNGSLPAFKKDAVLGIVHGPREHLLAIARRWLAPDGDPARGVDGFRLDAPENVPHPFWVDFRHTVKTTKPDAYIDGEIWPDAGAWLGGDQFDGVMNYQFAIAAQQFFVDRGPPTAFGTACGRLVMLYPFQAELVCQNLLDSHDTDRAGSMMVNPGLGFNARSKPQENPSYVTRKPTVAERQRLLQEAAFQMTFAGAPMVYYGDEAGMWGASDPSDRQPMVWPDLKFDDPNQSFDAGEFDRYQRLIAVRQALPALQTGFFRTLSADDAAGTFAYARDLGDRHAYVVLNRSDRPATVVVPGVAGTLIDWADPAAVDVTDTGDRPVAAARPGGHVYRAAGGTVRVSLPAYGVTVLAPAVQSPPASHPEESR